jgi:RimJ/RimL family protein N-acetyltransferase
MRTPFLVGEKVYLSPVETEDAPRLAGWINDPAVSRTLRRKLPVTVAMEKARIARMSNREDVLLLGVVERATDELIGTTGFSQLDKKNGHAFIEMIIGAASKWGRGYGYEAAVLLLDHAFQTLRLNRVWVQTFEFNQRVIRGCTRLGFRQEGALRQDIFRDGRYWDTLVFGLQREEWETSLSLPKLSNAWRKALSRGASAGRAARLKASPPARSTGALIPCSLGCANTEALIPSGSHRGAW